MHNCIFTNFIAIIAAICASVDIASAENGQQLTINPKINTILQKAVANGVEKFKAKSALGVILDATNSEVLASVSVGGNDLVTRSNYENAAALRIITYTQAFESGVVMPSTVLHIEDSPRVGQSALKDLEPAEKDLTVSDAFVAASNVATTKLALKIGPSAQRAFFEKLHQLTPIETGIGSTIVPTFHPEWDENEAAAIGFGHGVANSPLHAVAAIASIINSHLVIPTFLKKPYISGPLVVGGQTTETITNLLARNAERGRARHADLPVIHVAAVTATIEKIIDGNSAVGRLQCEIIAVSPTEKPRYVVLVLMDEPENFDPTAPSASTAGVVAAEFFRAAAPLVGLK